MHTRTKKKHANTYTQTYNRTQESTSVKPPLLTLLGPPLPPTTPTGGTLSSGWGTPSAKATPAGGGGFDRGQTDSHGDDIGAKYGRSSSILNEVA